jgi:hypothetical protein
MIISWLRLSNSFARLGAASRSGHALRTGLGHRLAPQLLLVLGAVTLLGGGILGGRLLLTERRGNGRTVTVSRSSVKRPVTAPVRSVSVREPSLDRLRAANLALERQLARLTPIGPNLIIDTAGNRVYLRRGEKIEAEMTASCGSGNILEDPKGGRRWIFDTPRGQFTIQSKITKPVWMKPDWAFIEEGERIPADPSARAEAGMMGDYALGLGQGYFIHGTLYTRLLGRNVSHGCVRLGDNDLERLYRSLPIGTRVLIF